MSESLAGWIERPTESSVKGALYRSKHDPLVPPTGSTFVVSGSTKLPGANLGPDSTAAIFSASAARRAASPRAASPPSSGLDSRLDGPRKPSVPRREERPPQAKSTQKDFVVANAVETILAVPPQRAPRQATIAGKPVPSDFLRKPEYGRVPEYLETVRQEVAEERRVIEEMFMQQTESARAASAAAAAAPRVAPMSDGEREELLGALKGKWDEVNRQYQKMTHMVKLDTLGKIRRKEQFEKELAQLERDIQLLSQKRPVAVVDE